MCGLIAIFNFNNLRVDNNIMEKNVIGYTAQGLIVKV